MNKVLAVSVFAILAAGAARADIASTDYVSKAIEGKQDILTAENAGTNITIEGGVISAPNVPTTTALNEVKATAEAANNQATTNKNAIANLQSADATLQANIDKKQDKLKQGANITIAEDGTISATDTQYTLPDATTSAKGGVIVGDNIAVASGKISVADATTTAKGVVKLENAISTSTTTAITPSAVNGLKGTVDGLSTTVSGLQGAVSTAQSTAAGKQDKIKAGTNITIADDGVTISAAGYTLPTASTTTKGGAKVDGSTITIADEKLSVGSIPASKVTGLSSVATSGYTLPTASKSTLGGVKVDDATVKAAADGTLSVGSIPASSVTGLSSVATSGYTLPTASKSTLGGVKVDDATVKAATDGTLSVGTIASTSVSGLGALATKNAVSSAEITDGTIMNADINANAAIDLGKLAIPSAPTADTEGTYVLTVSSGKIHWEKIGR